MVRFLYPLFGLSITRPAAREELLYTRYKSRQFMNRALRQDSDEEFLNAVGQEYELIVEKAVDYLANRKCSEAFYSGLLELKGDIDALAEILEQRLESAPYNQNYTSGLGFDVLFQDVTLANDNPIDFTPITVDAAPATTVETEAALPKIGGHGGRDALLRE